MVAKAEKGETFSYGLESDKKITISPNAVVTASGVTAALNKKPEGYTGEIGTTFVSKIPIQIQHRHQNNTDTK